jgi:DNA-binding YbaB/EbfC family protein
LQGLLRQAAEMQSRMAAAEAALAETTVEGSAGGGMVRAVVSGTGELRSITIARDVVDPDDVEMLEDLVVAAVADAMRAAREVQAGQMGSVTGGLDLGSLGGLLGS